MSQVGFKMVAVQFDPLKDADETALQAFITRELTKKSIEYDKPDTDEKKKRGTFRVKFNEMKIKAITEATQKVPQQQIEVLLQDLSIGGCCIGIPQNVPVPKGGTIYLTFHFCQPAVSASGKILGLKV